MTWRQRSWIAVAIGVAMLPAVAQAKDRQKQVLVLLSSRRDAQLARVVDREFQRLLEAGLDHRIDYYSEPLDDPRFTHEGYPAEVAEFLHSKYAGHNFDLIVPFGRAAMDFVASNRATFFPDAPVVFYALDPPRSQIPDATGLINQIGFTRSMEFGIALQPDLEHVYVVSGAAAVDRRYERQARQEFLPFAHRLDIVYLAGLATDDLLRRLRALPPRSAVLYVLVTQDGTGENVQQMEYLARVAAAAAAPTYSWADVEVDAGFVGGYRRDQLAEIKAVAALSLRVLRGERGKDIPVTSLQTDVYQADWRQLRHWNLSEARLPAGTRVVFREPTVWEQYKRAIIGAATLILAQSGLIGGLLLQRRKRRRAEVELRGSQTRLRVSYDRIRTLGRRLLGAQEAERARLARELHDDISQQLSILCIELDALGTGQGQTDGATLSRAMTTAQGVATSVRALSRQLHPNRLRLLGLVAAIDNLQRDFHTPRLSIEFSHRDVPPAIDHDVALSLFRVVQEALRNVATHSDAAHVQIDLAGTSSGVTLTVVDDGRGFDIDAIGNEGLGLISMRERMESAGGLLEIRSRPGAGTRLTATVPIPAPSAMLQA